MHVAAVQMRSTTDVEANVAAFSELVREAARRGASYVQTPEMTGLIQRQAEGLRTNVRDQANDPLLAAAGRLSQELHIWLHVGSTPIALAGGKVANRAVVFGPDGGIIQTYDKIHMFDVDLDNGESWRESAIYQAGDRLALADVGGTRVGLAICYDLRFPHLFRDLAVVGAGILAVPAAFTRQTGQAHWHALLRARAIENGCFVVAAAQGGLHEDGRETFGHSLIIDPWGRVIAEKADDTPGVIDAVINVEDVAAARRKIPNLLNARPYRGVDS